jgi:hypothetical protein
MTTLSIVWNALTRSERRDIILQTKLPTALESANWAQLTASEQEELYLIDWEKAVGRMQQS